MERKNLFAEFPPISTEQWEAQIIKDLKGADYDRKLVRKTLEGIQIRPYYRNENLESLSHLSDHNPGDFPFVRGNKMNNCWLIRQDILVKNYKEANSTAIEAIEKGADSICFILKNLPSINSTEFEKLLENLPFGKFELNFSCGKLLSEVVELINKFIQAKGVDANSLIGSFSYDPLGNMTITGSLCEKGLEENKLFSKEIYDQVSKKLSCFEFITIHANYFKNAGSTIVQELGFALSMANDYLVSGSKMGIATDQIASRIRFNFAVGPEYFMEIAKIRAARFLWAKIVDTYNPSGNEKCKMKIHSLTAEYNQTIYDPYVNMLRTTTEGMSAVVGGTDSLTIQPFNIQFDEANPFSERIARNQQIILKKESYLDQVADPSAGSYFIENLTNSIIEAAWQLFLDLEEKGGYFKAFKAGFVQELIGTTALKRDSNLASRQEILLGTNQYPNFKEKAKETIRIKSKKAGASAYCDDKIAEPIHIYRAAEQFEELRLRTENSGKTPKVFLFTFGNIGMRKARAAFSTNFFACAGFEVLDNNGFETVKEGIESAVQSQSEIVVICSSDEEYPTISKEIIDALRNKIIVIAGYPKDSLEQLQSFGIKYFIHIKSNILETLKDIQRALGIG